MKLFIDTANLEEIREINNWGVLSGVTTNPSLIAKENGVFEDVVEEITNIVDGPISAEVIGTDADSMVEEGISLSQIHENIVVKIPMTDEGLKAIKRLKEKNVPTNCTLIFSPLQALLAARAGASYVSPFIGRLDDIGHSGSDLIEQISEIFELHQINTEIIAASIRHPRHVMEAAQSGSDICTIPYQVFKQMLNHPLTDQGIEKFLNDFKGTQRR